MELCRSVLTPRQPPTGSLPKAKILFNKYLCQAPHNMAKCSLHDRRFMSQAGRTRYFARSARPREEKIYSSPRLALRARVAHLREISRPSFWLIKRLSCRLGKMWRRQYKQQCSRVSRKLRPQTLKTQTLWVSRKTQTLRKLDNFERFLQP